MSVTRKKYVLRLIFRCLVLLFCADRVLVHPEQFTVLEGMNFFRGFSWLHILWVIWVIDMVQQIVPIKNKLPLGSMKLFEHRFKPILEKINYQALRDYTIATTKAAYKVFIVWIALILAIGALYYFGVIGKLGLFMCSVCFYVCDLICVLIWCPFRLMMGNRCCTTCRIFNWDHLMMFSPLFFMGGFYGLSLALIATAAWLVWEVSIQMYPERFWEKSNLALRCSECTDKLCSQYCGKTGK